MNYIYHNPRWGKSRKSVAILEKENVEYSTIEYLKTPLKYDELNRLFAMLNIHPKEAIRKNEIEFKENDISKLMEDKNKLINAIIKFPKILERPIIVIGEKAIIGRPPEKIYDVI